MFLCNARFNDRFVHCDRAAGRSPRPNDTGRLVGPPGRQFSVGTVPLASRGSEAFLGAACRCRRSRDVGTFVAAVVAAVEFQLCVRIGACLDADAGDADDLAGDMDDVAGDADVLACGAGVLAGDADADVLCLGVGVLLAGDVGW